MFSGMHSSTSKMPRHLNRHIEAAQLSNQPDPCTKPVGEKQAPYNNFKTTAATTNPMSKPCCYRARAFVCFTEMFRMKSRLETYWQQM